MNKEGDGSFGARLRALREAASLTQQELASRAGLTAKAVSALERGERKRPYPHTIRSLADALGLDEHQRSALVASVQRQGSEAPAPAQTASAKPALAVPPTPLLGREKELGEIVDYLSRPGVRLLTLTGTGGVGKTRLAARAAQEAENLFANGAVFVALASLNSPALVVPAVVRALGPPPEAEGRLPHEILISLLRERELLLVLDNFEHVMDAAPEVSGLVEACPKLTVLVTSRAPLRIRSEQEYPVGPLALPTSTISPGAEEVLTSPAGRLFAERAGAASPSFEVTAANAAAIASICWRLAGLPLALELAAAKTRFLDPAALLARLDRALSASWARDVPDRQKTMRATLDWSHDLLSERERALFRCLSVFAGGFTLEAAESVANPGEVDPVEVLGLLGGLVEQSLVVAEPSAAEARYAMLEPVRQYALEMLEEDNEAEETRRRHAEYFLSLAERAATELGGPRQVEWIERLEKENPNLRAAMSWALSAGETWIAARLGWALWLFWWIRGYQPEGRRWMETLLESDPPVAQKAIASAVAGTMAYTQGDLAACERHLEQGIEWARQVDDKPRTAHMVQGLGLLALDERDFAKATSRFEEALELYLEAGGNDQMVSMVSTQLGTVLLVQGERDRSAEMMEKALAVSRRLGDRTSAVIAVYNLAQVALSRGDYVKAGDLLEEGIVLSDELGDKANLAYFLEGLAAVSGMSGGAERSARLFGAAEGMLEAAGAPVYNYYIADRALYEKARAEATSSLGERAFEERRAEGRSMTFEESVAYALAEGAHEKPSGQTP